MEITLSTFMLFFFLVLFLVYCLSRYFDGPETKLTHSMKGQTIVITGADSHIGWETVKDLLKNGARIIMACRNETKTNELISTLPEEDKKRVMFIQLDLTHYESIKTFVGELKQKIGKIDILVNNAGTCFQNVELVDGLDITFSTNYTGHVLLTCLLLDNFNPKGRIVNVTTKKYQRISQSDFDKWVDNSNLDWSYHKYVDDWMKVYVFSKFCNLLHSLYIKEYIEKNNLQLKVCCVHPGYVKNNFFSCIHTPYWYFRTICMIPSRYLFFKSYRMGAQTHLHACYYSYESLSSGSFLKDCKVKSLLKTACFENAKKLMKFTKTLFDKNKIATGNEEVEKFFSLI
ncbi:MAG: SDR family NAD(P)-dependent oxidoreductase [archaeon]|nr:SDR family NAD(P)-dependent oxidoreductase [archaeon]